MSLKSDDDDELVTPKEAAKIIKMSVSWLAKCLSVDRASEEAMFGKLNHLAINERSLHAARHVLPRHVRAQGIRRHGTGNRRDLGW
jgi:hypothetical protein